MAASSMGSIPMPVGCRVVGERHVQTAFSANERAKTGGLRNSQRNRVGSGGAFPAQQCDK